MPSSRITSLCVKGYSSHLLRVLEQKEMIPGTTYIRTWYVHQHFVFDFPFHEIYRRLPFFTLGRMYNTYDTRYVLCTRCVWYQVRTVSLFVYSLVGGGITRTFRPWTNTSDDSYIYEVSAVARCSDSYCIFILFLKIRYIYTRYIICLLYTSPSPRD